MGGLCRPKLRAWRTKCWSWPVRLRCWWLRKQIWAANLPNSRRCFKRRNACVPCYTIRWTQLSNSRHLQAALMMALTCLTLHWLTVTHPWFFQSNRWDCCPFKYQQNFLLSEILLLLAVPSVLSLSTRMYNPVVMTFQISCCQQWTQNSMGHGLSHQSSSRLPVWLIKFSAEKTIAILLQRFWSCMQIVKLRFLPSSMCASCWLSCLTVGKDGCFGPDQAVERICLGIDKPFKDQLVSVEHWAWAPRRIDSWACSTHDALVGRLPRLLKRQGKQHFSLSLCGCWLSSASVTSPCSIGLKNSILAPRVKDLVCCNAACDCISVVISLRTMLIPFPLDGVDNDTMERTENLQVSNSESLPLMPQFWDKYLSSPEYNCVRTFCMLLQLSGFAEESHRRDESEDENWRQIAENIPLSVQQLQQLSTLRHSMRMRQASRHAQNLLERLQFWFQDYCLLVVRFSHYCCPGPACQQACQCHEGVQSFIFCLDSIIESLGSGWQSGYSQ